MKTNRPIQAMNTERIMSAILPKDFKMVSDKNSNGYKFINLLYGAEIDQARDILKTVYNDSFFNTINLTKDFELYEVSLSGVPITNFLNNGSIKIVDEFEFYNGSPTRLKPIKSINIPMYYLPYTGGYLASDAGMQNVFASGTNIEFWSTMSGFTGLEYFRKTPEGSGYLLISSDYNQEDLYGSGRCPAFKCNVGTNFQSSGDYKEIYGFYTGIRNQDFNTNNRPEILLPIDSKILTDRYPLTRQVTDSSGMAHTIDHYTPYRGWIFNEYNEAVANVDYSGTYYFDSDGKKIYYRTAYNNPYGYNNYTTAYLDLEHIPISGTLKVYDIDILDISGNAIEIPSSGKILYYYKSPYMLNGGSGFIQQFDPIYMGYDSIVPSGVGFSSYMEGQPAIALKTTSWEYLHSGGDFDTGTLQYVDGSGSITNRIKLLNYNSRYLVEYKYKTHDQFKYISSLDSIGSVSSHSTIPIYTTNNYSGNLNILDYEFTKDPTFGSQSSKIITFDGLNVRPFKKINKIDFNIPIIHANGDLKNLYINTNKKYIGFSDEFIPVNTNFRRYVLNCTFDQNVGLDEVDLTGNSNDLTFTNTGDNLIFKINYDTYFGKKIIRGTTGDSYFYKLNKSLILNNTFFEFDFKLGKEQSGVILDVHDNVLSKYITMTIDSTGFLSIRSQGYIFNCREKLTFNNKRKFITIKYSFDKISENVPNFTVYYKEEGEFGYRIIECPKSQYVTDVVSSTYLYIYKNLEIDIGKFKIFYEVQ